MSTQAQTHGNFILLLFKKLQASAGEQGRTCFRIIESIVPLFFSSVICLTAVV